MAIDFPSDLLALRPLDRVLSYLELEIPAEQKRKGNRLPTTREVSQLIGVSPATVRNAYQVMADRGLIQTGVGSGSFWTHTAETQTNGEIIIGINALTLPSGQKAESWSYRIFGGLLRAAFEGGQPPRIQAVPVTQEGELVTDKTELNRLLSGLDGFILIPFYSNAELDRQLSQRAIPHVSLNPLSVSSTSRFVAPDYFQASRRVGQAFAESGRQRTLLFLSPGTERSVSCQLRLAGFLSGLHAGEQTPEFRKLIAPQGDFATSRQIFADFLDQGWIPDAVCTAGDDMALAALEVAAERGILAPEEMSVVGGSGVASDTSSQKPSLTAMVQPLEMVGEELIRMLKKVRQNPEAEISGIYLPMDFSIRESTRPSENAILKRPFEACPL